MTNTKYIYNLHPPQIREKIHFANGLSDVEDLSNEDIHEQAEYFKHIFQSRKYARCQTTAAHSVRDLIGEYMAIKASSKLHSR